MNLNTISLHAVTLILYNQEFQTLVDKRVVYINADPSALFLPFFNVSLFYTKIEYL